MSRPVRPGDGNAAVLAGMLGLLLSDLAFIALHVVARTAEMTDRMYRLDHDGSYAEWFQYAKETAIVLGLAALASRIRAPLYGAWATLFAYLLLDDHLSLHERGGLLLAQALDLPAAIGLRPQDFGELGVSLAAGTLLLAAVLVAHRRAARLDRQVSSRLVVLLAVLVFFGVGVDMLHIMFEQLPMKGLTVIEDGGEMVAMSLIATFVAWRTAIAFAPCQNSATLPQEEWERRSGR